jgi:DNA-binding transcriptional ArsR family regulator
VELCEIAKCLSSKSKISILSALKTGDKSVNEIVDTTNLKQANVSKHLKELGSRGVVECKKKANQRFYSINENIKIEYEALFDLIK